MTVTCWKQGGWREDATHAKALQSDAKTMNMDPLYVWVFYISRNNEPENPPLEKENHLLSMNFWVP